MLSPESGGYFATPLGGDVKARHDKTVGLVETMLKLHKELPKAMGAFKGCRTVRSKEAKEDGMHRSGLSILLIVCLFCVGFSSTPDSRVIMGKWVLVNGVYAGAVVIVDSTPKADRDSAQGLDVSYRGKLTITPFQMSLEGWKPGDVLWSDIRLRSVTDTLGGIEYNFSEVLIDRMYTEDGSSSYSTRVRRTVTVICNGPDTLIAQRLRGTDICYFGTPGAVACDIWERP